MNISTADFLRARPDLAGRVRESTAPHIQTEHKVFTLPYPPSANAYWSHTRTGITFVTKEARLYKGVAATQARVQGMKPIDGPVAMTIDVYRPKKSGDLDNTLKVLLDSLKGIAFEDDSQIVEITARRFDDKDRPRAEVTIRRSTLFGTQAALIFPTK